MFKTGAFALSVLIILFLCTTDSHATALPEASWDNLPRWRGFNLLNKFMQNWQEKPFEQEDFRWISELGFNFVRLPMDYRQWIVDNDWTKLNEKVLKEIDQAVAWGQQYNIHVCINFHRAPGYTVANPPEAKSLWTDPEAQKVCAMHWAAFAKRYKDIPNKNLSFNLLNEPAGVDPNTHAAVIHMLVEAIRKEDPNRLIIIDGLDWGNKPCKELVDLKIAQATRGYQPMTLTHYKANWVDSQSWPLPTWPQRDMDASILWQRHVKPWADFKATGVGAMVGEWGSYNKTPHEVTLSWMEDCLKNYRKANLGWALWNFRGEFGILDSGREDVQYEDFHGHKLDRKMLELLQKY
jgi:endoglucanase